MDRERLLSDIQSCFLALFEQLARNSPVLGDCLIIPGHYQKQVYDHTDQPIIYVGTPELIRQTLYLGSQSGMVFKLETGVWNSPSSGGIDEHQVVLSNFLYHFNNLPELHQTEFDIELKGVLYSAQSLSKQGIRILEIKGPVRKENVKSDKIHSKFAIELMI